MRQRFVFTLLLAALPAMTPGAPGTPGTPRAASVDRLPTTVVPVHYDLAFTVDLSHERFSGVETIHVRLAEQTSQIVLHALDLQIQDAAITSAASTQAARVALDASEQTARLSVPKPLAAGPAEIRLRFRGVLNNKLRGFYISKTARRKYAVTQFEATDARRAFPCFDEPSLKATFAVTLTVDRGDTAISNGGLLSDLPGPGGTQHTLRFATSPKMSSYLVAMAVGDFRCLESRQDGVPIRVCTIPEKTPLGQIALDSATQVLKFFNTYFTITYPFGKLDLVAVPDFAAGAMENTAAIFFREADLLTDTASSSVEARKNIASIVAHEMAHQWFGNLVTMAWWDDLWLNEGFATWMATRPLEAWHPEWHVDVDETAENQEALNLDALKSTHAIRARIETLNEIEASFDAITYQKGAAVLRMIEHYVGADSFRAGVNSYLQAHAYGNARAEDFWTAVASASGRPVDSIMPTFVDQPGVPLVEVSLRCEDDRTITRGELQQRRFSLERASPATDSAGVWRIPVCTKVEGAEAPDSCRVLDKSRQVFELSHGCPSWIFVNAGARGYYRTAYPREVLRALAPRIERSLSAPERLTLVEDEWALVSVGRDTMADYLTIASGFGGEQVSGVLAPIATRLGFISQYLTTDATAGKLQAFMRSLFRPSFDALGIEGRAGESDDRRALRAVVVAALGGPGADADVIANARAAVERALAGGAPLDPTVATVLIRIATANGDKHLYDALSGAAGRAVSPEEQYRYLYALPTFGDPALVERALQEVRSPKMKAQDTARYLKQFFDNPAARARAWVFLKQHWTEIEPRIKVAFGDVTLVASLGGFCEPNARDDIRAFFTTHSLPAASRRLDETIERIDRCIELRQTQTTPVAEWLDSRAR